MTISSDAKTSYVLITAQAAGSPASGEFMKSTCVHHTTRSSKPQGKQRSPKQTKPNKLHRNSYLYNFLSAVGNYFLQYIKYSICILLVFAYSICMLPSISKNTGRKETQSSALTQTHWTCCYMLLITACHFLCSLCHNSVLRRSGPKKPPHDPWPHFDSGQHPPEPSPRAQAKQAKQLQAENLTL